MAIIIARGRPDAEDHHRRQPAEACLARRAAQALAGLARRRRGARGGQARRDAALAQGAGGRRARHRHRRRAVAAAFRPRLSRVRRRHRFLPQGEDGHPQQPLRGDGAGGRRATRAQGPGAPHGSPTGARAYRPPAEDHDARADDHRRHDRRRALRRQGKARHGIRRAPQPGSARAREGRRRRDPVRRAGVQRVHGRGQEVGHRRARARGARPEVQDLRAHLLRLRHPGEHRLEGDPRRRVAPVRGDLSRAGEEQDRPGVARVHPFESAHRASSPAERQGRPGGRHRRRERQGGDAAGGFCGHSKSIEIRAREAPLPLHQLRHGADGSRDRAEEARSAGGRHRARPEEAQVMISCPHALASEAGADVLRAGGSAVDAAIAAAATLGVVYPHMCGLGGDAFWLIHDAAARKVSYLDGGGRAAASATLDRVKEIPFRGLVPATLTTPGAVASFCEAHARFGRLPLARCLEAAIHYARDGYPVTARLSRWIAETAADLAQDPASAALFPAGKSRLANPALAHTLEAIAADGRAGFYEGRVAAELARLGGFFTERDLAAQRAYWGEPIRGTYRGVTLYETPPPTQGLAVLEMLNLIEPLELGPYQGPDLVHLLVQAKQVAYNDRDHWLADPRFAEVPVELLISKSYADERRRLMDPTRALPWDKVPSYGSLAGDTVNVAVVDRDGNAVSLIFSLYGVFGACITSAKTGVVLQNRGAYFSLDPKHANRLEPGKVPLHTLIASLAFREDRLWAVLGCMGADGQPQIHLQTYVAMIDYGRGIQQALEAPRWLSGRFALGEARDTLHIEARYPRATIDELERRGHLVDRWGDWNELAGHANGITIDENGVREGGSDPRSDGAALTA